MRKNKEVSEYRGNLGGKGYGGRPGADKSARPMVKTMTAVSLDSIGTVPRKKVKRKASRILTLVTAMLTTVAVCVYAGIAYYFSDKFIPGTTVNGMDCSAMTAGQVEAMLAERLADYRLTVKARSQVPQEIPGKEIHYAYEPNGEILRLMEKQKPYLWLAGYFKQTSYSVEENVTYDKSLLESKVNALNCANPQQQVPPRDAYIDYRDHAFEIVPEDQGTTLALGQTVHSIENALSQGRTEVDLEQEGVYQAPAVTSEDSSLQEALQIYNQYSKASITYVIGEEQVVLDGNTIKDWLGTDQAGRPVKDPVRFNEKIREFVADLANRYDTYQTDRTFTATNGRQVTVYSWDYGWLIDEEAEAAQLTQEIESGQVTSREPIYSMTANSHGSSDVGDTYIEVDLGSQYMYYYKNGSVVFESPFISGKMDGKHQTREGIFRMYNRESPSVLKGEIMPDGKPEYVQDVTYWMAFDGGIGFHDANWQYNGFGGDLYLQGYGSHGCVNLPVGSAAQLYSIIRPEDPIVCFY